MARKKIEDLGDCFKEKYIKALDNTGDFIAYSGHVQSNFDFETMKKETTGKVDLSLIPTHAVTEMCRAFQYGIESGKYTRENRSLIKKEDIPSLLAAALRHIFKYMGDKEENAQDSDVHHLAHAMANLSMIMEWIFYYSRLEAE